jgi:Protein of unknown function (DUF3306)
MSDPERDDDKGFLARWSQRKHEARQPEPKPQPDSPAATSADPKVQDQVADAAEEFDLSSLPKLEDITGTTDISAFLRKGVPEHLRNAALRKSWALDPAVRNYVSPALEYAYDWNTPGGVPGSGELGAGVDVARMVAQIMGDLPREEPATPVEGGDAPATAAGPSFEHAAAQKAEEELPTQALRQSDEAVSSADDGGTEAGQGQESGTHDSVAPQRAVRRHGSAKPTV